MLHEARKRHLVLRSELAYGLLAACERFEHMTPRPVGERRKDSVEGVVRILNHSV